MDPEAAEEKAWELYRAAAVDDNTDYMICFFLASCHELNRTPDEALAGRVTADPNAVFKMPINLCRRSGKRLKKYDSSPMTRFP